MIRSIGRYFRALGYLLTGRVDSARKSLSANPYVIQATYDRVVEEKKLRINQYKDAVARMISQEETKLQTIKRLSEEANNLERLKEGAAAKARILVQQKQAAGQSMEQIKADPEYQKCLTAYNDFSSTSKEKTERIAEAEADAKGLQTQLGNHKVQLQQLLRDLEKVKAESAQTVAEVITAREEEELAGIIAGISQDRTGRELEELRALRDDAKSRARVSRELAGTDTKAQEAEFLEYARTGASTDEFDKLVGLAQQADAPTATPESRETASRLPEG